MDKNYLAYYRSEIGLLEIEAAAEGIVSIDFVDEEKTAGTHTADTGTPPIISECVRQLDEYFKGKRKEFTLDLLPQGTDFQRKAWERLRQIPYGETISYSRQAEQMGNKKACRAVGGANGKNPISIVIPCHRVIGKNGSLTGFGSGVWRKEWLLAHEKKFK